MKKILFIAIITGFYTVSANAVIYTTQEISVGKATFECQKNKCEKKDGEVEEGVKFEYISLATSNSGNSKSKKRYNCITTKDGAKCKAKYN